MTERRPRNLPFLIGVMKWINWIGLAVAVVVVLLTLLQAL